MKRVYSCLLFFLLLGGICFAQDIKRANVWYFGYNAGLDFNFPTPIKLLNGQINSVEAAAAISDTNGVLLFYSDGRNVWNKTHQLMANGTGLLADQSSTQGVIIVPKPGSSNLYYIFTTSQGNPCYYNIVDLNFDGGKGDIIAKNIILTGNTTEKISVAKHSNGKDYWIVTHEYNGNRFYSFLLNDKGIIDCPVISSIGTIYNGSVHAAGQMKFSANSSKLAVATWGGNTVEVFQFNTSTGVLSNIITLGNLFVPYGVEFSTSNNFLYVMERSKKLFQYDLLHNTTDTAINNSKQLIYLANSSANIVALQMAADNKIYLALPDSFYIASISYPDSLGSACAFDTNAVDLSPKRSSYGFPSFVPAFFLTVPMDFAYSLLCNERKGIFVIKAISTPPSLNWQIRKMPNGSITAFTTQSVSYTFPDSGLYEVRLIANSDTVTKTVFIDAPILPITDTLGCGVDSVVLIVPSTYRCLQWDDTSASAYSRSVKAGGTYYVQGYNSSGCLITDSVKIHFSPSPLQPTITKINDSLQSSPAFHYQWLLNDTLLTGATTQSIKPIKAGLYKVFVTDSNGCSNMSIAYSSNVGVLNPYINDNIRVYPNPASDKLYIESYSKISEVKIYDITGRIVFEKSAIPNSSLQINCNEFLRGIYFIKINSNLNTYYSHKIIIQ
jgi:hypothetical protein